MKRAYRFWSGAELRRLREAYPALGPTGCLPLFPGRNYSMLRRQARWLGVAGAHGGRRPRPERRA